MTGQRSKDPGPHKTDSSKELQSCTIQVDENGDWFHYGNRIFRPEILEALYSKLEQTPTGEFFLADSSGPCLVDVADTPFVVSRVDLEKDGSGRERIVIRLKNISKSEVLDPDTLAIGKGNVLYCRVLGGRFPARFSRPAYYQFAGFLCEDDTGQGFYIELNREKYTLASLVE